MRLQRFNFLVQRTTKKANQVIQEDSYVFDATNHLVTATTKEGTTQYTYVGNGNRIHQTTQTHQGTTLRDITYIVNTESAYQDIVMTLDFKKGMSVAPVETVFTYGNGLVSLETNDTITYYRIDEKQTVTNLLDASGVVLVTMEYEESTCFYYAKERYYDARIGRFVSADMYLGTMLSQTSYAKITQMQMQG